ncbi:MAG: molybdopterin synthase sulfur carrier subunit [Firmicutes bacterium HGW-Firmicutes-13]|nr:MAG: molybdopterin synthase sulfur carrier subunit [Firmicutes bacterium HGW-Firmicutes-13]
MKVKVRVFATLLEYVKTKLGETLTVELEKGADGGDLLKKINIPVNEVKLFIVNGKWQEIDEPLKDEDTIGIFPPVGGG